MNGIYDSTVILKKKVHHKTVIKDGVEETFVTEDTHICSDNEGPEELSDDMKRLLDNFMDSQGEFHPDPVS